MSIPGYPQDSDSLTTTGHHVFHRCCGQRINNLNIFCFQRNQVGSSTGMEFEGFKQCMEYLIGYGILITTFTSDRHTAIASHMKKVFSNVIHYFDIWHLKKSK